MPTRGIRPVFRRSRVAPVETTPKQPRATIRDVADLAGVALSSVSRVLNDHPAVSETLRQRVLAAVADLDYQADFTATSLRRGSTMTVGFLVRDIASPLFADLVKAAEESLGRQGYSLLLMNSGGDPDREAAHIRALGRRRVDGLILSLSSETHPGTLAAIRLLRCPIVLVDRAIGDLDASSVVSDHYTGVRAATIHLASLNHRRIALINGPLEVLAARERLRGYRAGLRSSGLRYDADLVRTGAYAESLATAEVAGFLASERPPTAFIAGGAMLTYGALRAIREAGLSLPDDVALVGCDGWRAPDIFQPSLTRVARDHAEMGASAAGLLLEAITDGAVRNLVLPTSLVVGATTSMMPDADGGAV